MGSPSPAWGREADMDTEGATTTTYGYLVHFQEKVDGGISVLRHSAIYRDRWARRDGAWRILERTLSNVGEDGPVLRPPDVRLFKEPLPL